MSDEKLLVGNYELKNCVASGATTQIWEVSQIGSPMQLAMKLMLDEHRKNFSARAVLKHEFKIGQLLTHPSFLRFHEIEINRDHSFFVMDYFRSPSLKTQITSNLTSVQSAFPKMAESLATALHFMHEAGWLHRDIKPDNILVNKAGEIRLIDFSLSSRIKGGLSKMLGGKEKRIQGTRTYIAPETILKKSPTPQTDMYSLGVTLFEVLTGQPVFAGDTPNALLKKHLGEAAVAPSAFNSNVTKELDKIILQMLEKSPQKRFDSMGEVANALRNVRCFEEDPIAKKERIAKELADAAGASIDKRLDSRADAERTAKGIELPTREKKKKRIDPKLLREEAERKAKEAAPAQPQMPAAGMMPMPQMPMPQMPPMQMPMPQMPMQMPPGQMPPQMPMPQMPMQMPHAQIPMPQIPQMQMPPGQMPGQPMPPVQQQPAQQQPAQQQPAQQQPVQQQPAQQQPVQQQPTAAPTPPAPENPPAAAKPEEKSTDSTEDMMDLMSQLNIE